MNKCLIVIDAQESFRHRPYFTERDMPAYLAAQNALISAAQKNKVPIVRIFHVDGEVVASNAFAQESGFIKPIKGLTPFDASATFTKSRHSALVGTGLEVWLRERNINSLIISGIRTEQCCETTTRHASDIGFTVDYVLDATLTFDMKHLDDSLLSATDIKARTAAVLAGRFATIGTARLAIDAMQSH
jgi:nicotinamidase-related amidase